MAGTDVRQLLLQVDASVAVAQRNLQNLARQVANDSNGMDAALSRVDGAFNRISKSAEQSANAFIEGDRAAKRLIASIDPLAAAQLHYDNELEKANQLLRTGALEAEDYARVQAGLKSQLENTVASYGRVGGASGALRSGMQQLSFQVGDVAQGFALGVRPMTIFAQQSGQVIQAVQLMSGGTKGFLSLLAGPWGIALSVAASALVLLASKHKEAGKSVDDLVKDMRKQADQARQQEIANKIWANSLDAVRDAQKKLREEIEKGFTTPDLNRLGDVNKAQTGVRAEYKQLASLRKQLAELEAARVVLEKEVASPSSADIKQQEASRNQLAAVVKDIADTKRKIDDAVTKRIPEAKKAVTAALVAMNSDIGKASADMSANLGSFIDNASALINKAAVSGSSAAAGISANVKEVQNSLEAFRQAASDATEGAPKRVGEASVKVASLTKALIAGKIGPDAYTKSIREMTKALAAAAKAAEDAKKGAGDLNKQFGREVDFAGAKSIAAAAGLNVTSAYRSTAKQAALYNDPSVNRPGNPVAKPGSSAHEGVNGRWALDIAFAPGLTPGKIKKIYGDQGVSLSTILKENGHFHIEGKRAGASGERAAASAEAKQARNDNSFEEQSDKLERQLLAAQMDLIEGTEEKAKYAHILAAKAQEDADAAIQNDVEEGKYTQAQADILKAKNAEIKAQIDKNIEIQKQLQTLKEQDALEQDAYDFSVEMLKAKEASTRTIQGRRDIELQIIDILYEEKQKHLETLKAQAELAGNIAEASRIQAEINRLPARKANDVQAANDNTKGPWESYVDSLPHDAADMQERLQALKVQGVEGLVDALAHAGDGWKAMRDIALRAIQDILAQLIKLQLEKALFSIIGSAVGAPSLGAGAGAAANFSTAGIGAGAGAFGAAIPHFAKGGFLDIGGSGGTDSRLLSIDGVPRAMVSPSETMAIIPKMARVGAVNDNRAGGDHFHISVSAPNTGNPRKDRATSLQQASDIQRAVAKANRRGM